VIIDYKSGSQPPVKYTEQMAAYRDAWEQMGCGTVKETGLLYVDSGEYVPL
jgi:hypothetical protein